MRLWYFTEQQYHPGWELVDGPIRNTPQTRHCDPEIAADLIDRYYEEFSEIDEMGMNIAVNEHHTSFQSMSVAPYLSVAAIARTTSKARILSIGTPIGQRPDPVRVAEEIALTDVMSRGRTECGFIKSIPWEYFNSNANPVRVMDRFWEANDLIIKALTTRDGPFHWEGEFFRYRNVNIVPTPYQDPHPPLWMTGTSAGTARAIAARDYVAVISQSGRQAVIPFFEAYRDQYRKSHGREAPAEKMGYTCYLAIGDTEEEARQTAQAVHKWVEYLPSQHPGYQHAAGYAPAQDFARMLMKGPLGQFDAAIPSIEDLRERHVMFYGTPDQVYEQFTHFQEVSGGIGNLLFQMGGYATKAQTLKSLRLMQKEVLPRLAEYKVKSMAA